MILRWADAHFERTGRWPRVASGGIPEAWGETWSSVSQALDHGRRGLPGGSSLAQLLAEYRGVRNRMALPRLTKKQILAWADAHHGRTGGWPTQDSGSVLDARDEDWKNIHRAMLRGDRGLPGGESLARLLEVRRGVRNRGNLPRLTKRQILAWADVHHRRTGEWPTPKSGCVLGALGEKWYNLHVALHQGGRGLPGGDSLPRLLARYRRVRHAGDRPRLTQQQILAWADAHHDRTGNWPTENSGRIVGAPGETWKRVSSALRNGHRGPKGGSSLTRLLEERRGYRCPSRRPRLTHRQILASADAHRRRTGGWPTHVSGRVVGTSNETWMGIESALVRGHRGLRGGYSLARLLEDRRGYRNPANRPQLTTKQILTWADAHHRRTGKWPTRNSGPIKKAPGETWRIVDNALLKGHRGLAGGSSVARLLAERRGQRNPKRLPKLTIPQILKWADAHHRRTGKWPSQASGPVVGAPGEKWRNIENSLRRGQRGLPAGLTIATVLARQRSVHSVCRPPRLTKKQIFAWAQDHYRRTGEWPTRESGDVIGAPGERWRNINAALEKGLRGMPGGSSLARFLAEQRRL